MYADVTHETWDAILPYETVAYNTPLQKTTQMAPYKLVYLWSPAMAFDAMLPVITNK